MELKMARKKNTSSSRKTSRTNKSYSKGKKTTGTKTVIIKV